MARREIDPFEIGRRSLAIPFRELPLWFACALYPFAGAFLEEAGRRGWISLSDWVATPVDWLTEAIFEWCWMTVLCRSTVLHLVTFPLARGFWLFLLLQLGLALFWWLYEGLLSILGFAAYMGLVPFTDLTGMAVQVAGVVLAIPTVVLAIWASLRLAIWPAHCVATGTLVGPRVIWRGMQDHSFDMLVIGIITVGPALLLVAAFYFLGRELVDSASLVTAIRAGAAVVKVYVGGAFAAAALIAYYEIFAVQAAKQQQPA